MVVTNVCNFAFMGVGATECGKLELLTSSITLMNNQTDWSGLAGLGPLAGWEVRPCGHFLGQLRLSWVAAQQHSRRVGKSPAQLKKLLCEIVTSAFNKLHRTEQATTTRHCLPHAWERGDIKKTLTATCPHHPRQLLGISADALPNLQFPSGRA